jgi:hypothetical protein
MILLGKFARSACRADALVFGKEPSWIQKKEKFHPLNWGKGMEQNVAAIDWKERRSEPRRRPEQYHSAEFIFEEAELHYQFKIWDTAASSMCVLVKESSEVLHLMTVGKTLRVRYYSQKSPFPSDALKTVIRHVTRNDQGKFKGHFLVGLEILPEEGEGSEP